MRSVVRGILLGTALVASVSTARAQGVASNLRELQLLVRPGETVTVTDAQGREVQGQIQTLSPSLLALSGRSGRRAWTEVDIVSIRQRKSDSLWNGALIGLAVGGGVGIAGGIAATEDNKNEKGWVPFLGALYGGIGAGIGVGIDAMFRDDHEIFRSTSAPQRTEVGLVPLLTPKRQGLLVSLAF
ncbi:hypothetical protein [Luteitalea sp.]|uniref:hypothetical protein n=1 Tax=Luteitalea sp. TaxID=2004800 RepID=UPI0025BBBD22|nr:hypothetical protein [Luteitalea sp.]